MTRDWTWFPGPMVNTLTIICIKVDSFVLFGITWKIYRRLSFLYLFFFFFFAQLSYKKRYCLFCFCIQKGTTEARRFAWHRMNDWRPFVYGGLASVTAECGKFLFCYPSLLCGVFIPYLMILLLLTEKFSTPPRLSSVEVDKWF